jgi:hypothetical protein
MRMIVIKQGTDLQALGARLLGAAREGALQSLQRLNPHVDFKRIEPGTVVLVPEQPGLREGESASVGGEAFGAFSEQARAALEATATRVRSGHEARLAQQKDVAAVLKSPALKRLLEADPDLKKELDAALQVFKDDQQAAKESEKLLKTLQDESAVELAALGKLIG